MEGQDSRDYQGSFLLLKTTYKDRHLGIEYLYI
jgi:hypothetical protein